MKKNDQTPDETFLDVLDRLTDAELKTALQFRRHFKNQANVKALVAEHERRKSQSQRACAECGGPMLDSPNVYCDACTYAEAEAQSDAGGY